MGFSGGGSSATQPHTHDSNIINDGGSLNFNNITQGGMAAGDITYSDGNHLQILTYPVVPAGETLTATAASTAPSWAGASTLELLQYRLPQEDTETVVLNELYRMGSKNWKVTQIEKPIKFEANDNSDLIAINDDMTGYANDTEFDAVWVSTDATNLSPDASQDRINCSIPDGSSGVCTFDLGHTIDSNAVWSLSWSVAFTATGSGSRNKKANIGISSTTGDFNATQSFIGFALDDQSSVPMKQGILSVENTNLDQGVESFSVAGSATQKRFVMNGLGYGLFSCTIYDGMDYGQNNEEETRTFYWTTMANGAVTTGLRYLKIVIYSKSNGGTPAFYVSNIQFSENDQPLLLGKAN
jgi:hypothetical protein